ncbi:hypothetical protein Vafri_15900 [Volvox africanus]|uniref:Uncharacterized protein n=1 Tax=Volvox africanus TaxID=51714 RepID=A0A8J4BHM4_9CHLO|nr:hypothetical protein Vafri_15900 [Volvox africanus]
MTDSDCVTFAPAESIELAPKVILGTVDVAAVGARVLLSLEPPPGWDVRETALELRGLQRSFAGSSSDGNNAMEGASEPLRPVLAVAAVAAIGTEALQISGAGAATATSSSSSPSPSNPPVALMRNFFAPPPTPPPEPGVGAGVGAGAAGPRVTLLILNTAVPEGAQAEVAAALLDFLDRRRHRIAADSSAAAMEEMVDACEEAECWLGVVAAMLLQQLAPPAGWWLWAPQ